MAYIHSVLKIQNPFEKYFRVKTRKGLWLRDPFRMTSLVQTWFKQVENVRKDMIKNMVNCASLPQTIGPIF